MKKILLIFVFCIAVVPAFAATKLEEIDVPKNVMVVSQSSDPNGFTNFSAIDLSNNDLVIIVFKGDDGSVKCYKTGAKSEPGKQAPIPGKK
jgi:hypothetical protein